MRARGGRGRKRECMYVMALMDVKGQPLGIGPGLSTLFESGWVSLNLPGCLTPKLLGFSCLCLSSPHRGSLGLEITALIVLYVVFPRVLGIRTPVLRL